VVPVRTSRLIGAAALLLALARPSAAAAQPGPCPEPGLGPPTACVAPGDGATTTSLAPAEAAPHRPGPALWVGAVFGVSGLVGIAFATGRLSDPQPEGPA